MHLATAFELAVSRYPEAEALVTPRERLTYAAWHERVEGLAEALAQAGVATGDRVALCVGDPAGLATAFWAVQAAGATAVLLHSRWKAGEVAYALDDSRPRLVVYDPATAAAVLAAVERCAVAPPTLELVGLRAVTVPGAANTGRSGDADSAGHASRSADSGTPCGARRGPRRAGGTSRGPGARRRDAATATIFYTSGTTGRPKGVVRTHRSEYHSALALIVEHGWGRFERVLGVMPLYHTMGLHTVISLVLLNGTLVAPGDFDPPRCLQWVQSERVSALYLVPTAFHDLVEAAAGAQVPVPRLAFAGAPMAPELVERCREVFRPQLFVNHYGCTEMHLITVNRRLDQKPRSAGRPGLHTRLLVVRTGADRAGPSGPPPGASLLAEPARAGLSATGPSALCLGPGEVGEVVVDASSPQAFVGYLNRPDATRRALRGGWYFTGDLGYLDGDGDLYVVGRVDDLIITGGENVYPAEVEAVLGAHPGVREVAVVGLPDPRWGQAVTAFVVPRSPGLTADELDRFCLASTELARFKRPRRYVFVARLPRSPTGKLLRALLRESAGPASCPAPTDRRGE